MANTVKVKFNRSRGYNGAIIRAGATVEISEFWAKIFLADGTASEVTNGSADSAKSQPKAKKPKGKK